MNKSRDPKDISRRRFLGLTGGAAGMIALTAYGFRPPNPEMEQQFIDQETIDPETIGTEKHQTDVLVIGGGMAGLFAAVKAHDAEAKVTMVLKGRLGASGQTPFAKGIFVFDAAESGLSLDEFVDRVSYSALGTNNPVYTRQMAEHSQARVQELREWGFFDSPLYNKSFSKPINDRNIELAERVHITKLIKENGRIAGAAGFSLDDEKLHIYQAKTVILCTGAGGFKPNGFPICDLTHDGTIMAYNIGAKVTGKEWNDGHSGQSTNPAACFDGWHGMFERKPNTTSVEIHHDLGVDMNYQAYKNGNPVMMGPPGREKGNIAEGGPYRPEGLNREIKNHDDHQGPPKKGGRPPKKGGGPGQMGASSTGGSSAGMSIHKSEGLAPINDKCASNIPGLYAAGDALGSYMAGAIYTQIGSSLSGSAVQGAIAGEAAAKYSQTIDIQNINKSQAEEIKTEILAPLYRKSGYSPAWVTQTLQGIMIPNFVLYIKKENLLRAALAYIEELRDHHMPMLRATDMHELRLAHETANMILSAEMKLKASIMRTESRCSHYRLDYPEIDDKNWRAWINIYKGEDGSMKFEKQDFDQWPA